MDNSLALGASRLVYLLLLIYVKSPNCFSAFFLLSLNSLAFTCPHTPLPLTQYSLTESVYRSFKGAGSYGAVNLKHECRVILPDKQSHERDRLKADSGGG